MYFCAQQWRRRFFVLYAPPRTDGVFPSSRGHSAFLHYYESEKITKKKGSIDLDNCEELRDRLDSTYYRHLFSLTTSYHDTMRTYYLAADTEAEMDVWVRKLTEILDFSSKCIECISDCTYIWYFFCKSEWLLKTSYGFFTVSSSLVPQWILSPVFQRQTGHGC